MKVTFFLLGILLFLVACTPNPLSAIKTPTQLHAISLRSLAQERSFLVGAAVEERFMQGDPAYADLLSNQFNLLTPEDSMKFSSVHPEPGVYDFQEADALVAFASAHQMLVRGHTLVWDNQLPEWLTSGNYSQTQLIEILRDHIQRVVSHFKGQVVVWDVVNEAFDEDGNLRDTIWSRGI